MDQHEAMKLAAAAEVRLYDEVRRLRIERDCMRQVLEYYAREGGLAAHLALREIDAGVIRAASPAPPPDAPVAPTEEG